MTRRNLQEAHSLIERVRDADLVVLPELFHSGYAVRNRDEAESLSVSRDEQSEPLAMCTDTARSFNLHIAAGFLERIEGGNLFNSSWLIGPDGIRSIYRKAHLFNHELDVFTPGEENPEIVRVDGARVGMQICFDWVFPETWGRLARDGAQIVAHPSNLVIPDACPLAIRTRAMENRIFIITAGRVGVDPGPDGEIIFRAGSRIVAPDGTVLSESPDDVPHCDLVTIDPEWADDKYITPRNDVMKDRFGSLEDEQAEREIISK